MAVDPEPDPFTFAPDDPLAEEHAAVLAWVEELRGTHRLYTDVDLKTLPSGRRLLEALPEQARRYVLAATAQARYWDGQLEAIQSWASNEEQRLNPHWLPGWTLASGHRKQTAAVIFALMRRTLALEAAALVALLDWCASVEPLIPGNAPIGVIVRAVERFAASGLIDPDLFRAMKALGRRPGRAVPALRRGQHALDHPQQGVPAGRRRQDQGPVDHGADSAVVKPSRRSGSQPDSGANRQAESLTYELGGNRCP